MLSNQSKRTIIIDADPGQDDAVAILFALAADDRVDVRAITTVAGNVTVDLTSRNARIVRDWAGRTEVPVYAGCPRPLVRNLVTAENIHGKEGLEGVPLDPPKGELSKEHAVDFLIDTLRAAPQQDITLCLIGPLTNLAAALIQAPDVKRGIRELVLMGGSYLKRGNITPTAEFNIFVDPHAAEVVFESGLPITVLPLDVTQQLLTTAARVERLRKLGNKAGELIAGMLTSYQRQHPERFSSEGVPLHDPSVIGYLVEPSLFSGRSVNVAIETRSDLTLGETVVDWNRVTERPVNALWINEVNSEGFYSLMIETVARLP